MLIRLRNSRGSDDEFSVTQSCFTASVWETTAADPAGTAAEAARVLWEKLRMLALFRDEYFLKTCCGTRPPRPDKWTSLKLLFPRAVNELAGSQGPSDEAFGPRFTISQSAPLAPEQVTAVRVWTFPPRKWKLFLRLFWGDNRSLMKCRCVFG